MSSGRLLGHRKYGIFVPGFKLITNAPQLFLYNIILRSYDWPLFTLKWEPQKGRQIILIIEPMEGRRNLI